HPGKRGIVSAADIITAWDQADPTAIHPSRDLGEDAYDASGRAQANALATVIPAGARILDFGAGDGRVTLPLADLGYQVTAADSSPRMLARLTTRAPGIDTVHTDGQDLLTKVGRKQDAALCLAVLIHHTRATGAALVAQLRDTVKAGGLLILDWPTSETPEEASSWLEVTTWDPAEQDALCARLGLKALDTDLPWSVYRAVKPT
ncbi:class I SAM-dependent methyltransferase, partial [Streptomyces hydrogenans]|uniref:class I SAM-dependent methyltransferase n=1 Tax=Streptomyces hydrogenans TaxID=1873719 RepID=UPI0036A9D9C1